jgi:hypothetical protein
MSIELKLASLAETAKRVRHSLESEEATKTALVLPFLMALDYSVFDPTEVVPEYRADVKGVKHQERVDYAILRKGEPIILIEAKQANASLGNKNQITQLYRYWNETSAKVGILTNGIDYRFYGDADHDNKMDFTPFLTVDITNMSERDVSSVSAFSKYNYDLEDTAKLSEELYYQTAIRKVLVGAFKDPQTPFVRWIMTRTYEGVKTASKIQWFKEQVKVALQDFCMVNHHIGQAQVADTTIIDQLYNEATEPTLPTKGWTGLDIFEAEPGTKPPPTVRFSSGEERSVGNWKALLIEVAEWMAREDILIPEKCPVPATRKGSYYADKRPIHENGRDFASPHRLANGVYIVAHGSASALVDMSKRLLEKLDQDPAQVWLKTG